MIHSMYGALCADPSAAALLDPSILTRDTTFTKIFVGGLPYHTTDKTLREYFEQFGDIEEAVVITDRQTGKSKGYGFVTMRDRAGAERACKDPNPIIDGRKANVNLAYLGAKPRANLQLGNSGGYIVQTRSGEMAYVPNDALSGLQLPSLQSTLPAALLPGRLGLSPQTLYYPASSTLLASPSLMIPPVSPLSPSGSLTASQLLDYQAAAATGAYTPVSFATNGAGGYDPHTYSPTFAGMIPSHYGYANQAALNPALTGAYQAAAAAAAAAGADRV